MLESAAFQASAGTLRANARCLGRPAGDNEAHEHVELQGRIKRLANVLDHHAYPTVACWVEKHNRYAIWEAAQYEHFLKQPIPSTIGPGKRAKRFLKKIYLRLPMRPLIRFLYSYVVRLGFMDGKPGLIFCVLLSFYDFLAWANVYEMRVSRDAERADATASLPASETRNRAVHAT